MERFKPILNIVIRVLFVITFLSTTLLSLFTGYIMFAPDSFPKPFYLVYAYPGSEMEIPAGTVVIRETLPDSSSSSSTTSHTAEGETEHSEMDYSAYTPGSGIMYDSGTKIVNLADPGGRRYLRVNIVLEFAPNDAAAYEEYLILHGGGSHEEARMPASGGETEEIDYVTSFIEDVTTKQPVIDDIINIVVSSHTYDELYSSTGKEALKQELITRINEVLPGFHVIAVYFPEFVIE